MEGESSRNTRRDQEMNGAQISVLATDRSGRNGWLRGLLECVLGMDW